MNNGNNNVINSINANTLYKYIITILSNDSFDIKIVFIIML